MQTSNPFQTILDELGEVKEILYSLKKEPEIELKKKLYSIKECSEILKLDYQTVRSHILKGNIKAEQIGRFYRISHLDLMNALNDVKSLKYKR
ncbi:DNA-binding protein [Chryseobacterium carnipullorum]|uniref:DNA-binding protein n=2 Tax=Chryseobacterium TaxID=59732 RepID=A0A3G6RIH0_CHRLC|nr:MULTISPECIES: helix-turn-helix domain-containing protein [Chryseobacterium]AZA50566.1 DNA-binding protein [Chryseobacterium carnipullorum]AZA65434.1 DNA-binding protein [Chryseobacterium carnipullorum]AZA83278.1 DNA-binding protein [Chryseobacterium lactis]AZB03663.1 DNA-binding protein [Chryseobacterium lactis]PNW11128.1 DNA-binding protein [Chryseobacterium lactis]